MFSSANIIEMALFSAIFFFVSLGYLLRPVNKKNIFFFNSEARKSIIHLFCDKAKYTSFAHH